MPTTRPSSLRLGVVRPSFQAHLAEVLALVQQHIAAIAVLRPLHRHRARGRRLAAAEVNRQEKHPLLPARRGHSGGDFTAAHKRASQIRCAHYRRPRGLPHKQAWAIAALRKLSRRKAGADGVDRHRTKCGKSFTVSSQASYAPTSRQFSSTARSQRRPTLTPSTRNCLWLRARAWWSPCGCKKRCHNTAPIRLW